MLSSNECEQYSKQIALDQIGFDGQLKLKNAKVLCVGAGGLGTAASLYLASAGVGTIGIVDGDCVERNNLPRQILYALDDIGRNKAAVAKEKLKQVNSNCIIEIYDSFLRKSNALEIMCNYDIILDCSDNFATRYLISDACWCLDKVNVAASVDQFNSQCIVFYGKRGPCYRCLYQESSGQHQIRNCQQSGVLNTVAGMTGVLQANEVIKCILGLNEKNSALVVMDLLAMKFKKLSLTRDPECKLCSGEITFADINYSAHCEHVSEHCASCTFSTIRGMSG